MNNRFFIPVSDRPNDGSDQWSDFTVLYGCVSVGNVPQLTIDLIISTLIELNECQICGYIYSPSLMPLSGPDPYRFGTQLKATSCQVFECVNRKLLIIQQRSPIYKDLRKEFYESFTKWLSGYHFKRVVILSSSFIEHLVSALDSGDCYPIKYLKNQINTEDERELNERLNWKAVEKVDAFSLEPSPDGVVHLPGSGSAKDLLKYLDKYKISAIGLVLYCSEGDNRPHSYAFVNAINRWLNIIDFKTTDSRVKTWVVPFSWRLLFGEEPPQTIF